MADINVYKGGIPDSGFDGMQSGDDLQVMREAENTSVPGMADATRPKVVNQGGATVGKTYDQNKSQDFLLDSSYKTDMEAGRPGAMDIDNPDTISHADHTDDEDLPRK